MRWKLVMVAAAAAALLGLGAGPVRAGEEELRESLRRATPAQRLEAWKLVREKYPNVRSEVQEHLHAKYPDLEVRAARAMLKVGADNPGLVWSLPRHLLADLGGEPLQAFMDVRQAAVQRYPELPRKLRELRRQRGAVMEEFPGFRTAVLGVLRQEAPGALMRIRSRALGVLAEKHPDLRLAVMQDVSSLVDEKYPDLPAELRRSGERPGVWLVKNRPGFLAEVMGRVARNHGNDLRAAAVDVLAHLEKTEPNTVNRVAGAVLDLVEQKYPTLPARRAEARRERREAILAEFPELPAIVARTMTEKHPDLLQRALASVEKHHPDLANQARSAMEAELPGLHEEVHSFVKARYPSLLQDLQRTLGGATST